ncbi:MAG: LysE family transporter [Chitinivibrionales bacterium]|nr:LysE family transporter [Chitinivibrionales bacterium]
MIASLVTISIVGLAAGIFFSMPAVGPISILIVSHALKGQWRYCIRTALGASVVDLIVCFLAVNGVSRLFGLYIGFIPYILVAASVVIFIIGLRIMRTRFNIEGMGQGADSQEQSRKFRGKGAFLKALLLNASNPLLFFGWLTASFLALSLVSSWGFSVGGLDNMLGNNVGAVKTFAATHASGKDILPLVKTPDDFVAPTPSGPKSRPAPLPYPRHFQLFFSVCYAFCVALGTNVWFWSFSYFLVRNRLRLRLSLISRMIQGLGLFLCGFSLYILGRGIAMIAHF